MKIIDVLKMAYTMEVQGMKFYSEQMGNVKNINLKKIFKHLSNRIWKRNMQIISRNR